MEIVKSNIASINNNNPALPPENVVPLAERFNKWKAVNDQDQAGNGLI